MGDATKYAERKKGQRWRCGTGSEPGMIDGRTTFDFTLGDRGVSPAGDPGWEITADRHTSHTFAYEQWWKNGCNTLRLLQDAPEETPAPRWGDVWADPSGSEWLITLLAAICGVRCVEEVGGKNRVGESGAWGLDSIQLSGRLVSRSAVPPPYEAPKLEPCCAACGEVPAKDAAGVDVPHACPDYVMRSLFLSDEVLRRWVATRRLELGARGVDAEQVKTIMGICCSIGWAKRIRGAACPIHDIAAVQAPWSPSWDRFDFET